MLKKVVKALLSLSAVFVLGACGEPAGPKVLSSPDGAINMTLDNTWEVLPEDRYQELFGDEENAEYLDVIYSKKNKVDNYFVFYSDSRADEIKKIEAYLDEINKGLESDTLFSIDDYLDGYNFHEQEIFLFKKLQKDGKLSDAEYNELLQGNYILDSLWNLEQNDDTLEIVDFGTVTIEGVDYDIVHVKGAAINGNPLEGFLANPIKGDTIHAFEFWAPVSDFEGVRDEVLTAIETIEFK